MAFRESIAALALLGTLAAPATASAMGAVGCNNLPEHDRAIGTIENGEYSCGLSMAEARAILARDGQPVPGAPVAAAPTHHRHRKHHHQD